MDGWRINSPRAPDSMSLLATPCSYLASYSPLEVYLPLLHWPTLDGRSAPIGRAAAVRADAEDPVLLISLHPSPILPICIWSCLDMIFLCLLPWCGSVELDMCTLLDCHAAPGASENEAREDGCVLFAADSVFCTARGCVEGWESFAESPNSNVEGRGGGRACRQVKTPGYGIRHAHGRASSPSASEMGRQSSLTIPHLERTDVSRQVQKSLGPLSDNPSRSPGSLRWVPA